MRASRLRSVLNIIVAIAFMLALPSAGSQAGSPNLLWPMNPHCKVNPVTGPRPQVPLPFCIPCASFAFMKELEEWTMPPGLNITSQAGTYNRLRRHIQTEVTAQQVWTVGILFEDNILPAMMLMAEQLTAVAMKQAEIIGAFLDAKQQLETQQLFQRLDARAHKDYQPSVGMCEFGSSMKSLAASERKSEVNAVILSQRAQDRAVGNANTAAATGEDGDKESRIKQFREKFCDPRDNNDGLSFMCEHDQDKNLANSNIGAAAPGGIGAPQVAPPNPPGGAPMPSPRMNKDIDYIRTVDYPWTLDADLTDTTLTNNEEEVLALASNLYGNDIFTRPPSPALKRPVAGTESGAMQRFYMDARALIAKRSVAENSFNAITAMKFAGEEGSKDYLAALLRELGVPLADIKTMIGDKPSYYAQMEVLTKKIYQNPDFFTNLYDKPANVERKGVAIQAIGLMQKFDLFKSYLRSEASLSVLLELAVSDLQDEIENEINQISGQGPPAR